MLRQVVLAAAALGLAVLPALAVEPPADEEACRNLLQETEFTASERDIDTDTREKIDALLNDVETHCSAAEYADAAKKIGQVQKMMPQ